MSSLERDARLSEPDEVSGGRSFFHRIPGWSISERDSHSKFEQAASSRAGRRELIEQAARETVKWADMLHRKGQISDKEFKELVKYIMAVFLSRSIEDRLEAQMSLWSEKFTDRLTQALERLL